MAIEFFRSTYDEFNAGNNGGDITSIQIESGVINSFIPAVRPRQAEIGAERWFKFFVKSDIDIITIGIDIAKYTSSPKEEIYFALETKSDHSDVESDLDKSNIRIYGGFNVNSFDASELTVTSDRDVNDFVKADDNVTFYDNSFARLTSMIVDSVSDDGLTITVKLWSNIDITNAVSGTSSLYIDELDNTYVGVWIKEVIPTFTEAMEITPNAFNANVWYDAK